MNSRKVMFIFKEAMENWGLIVFKESLLLIDPDNFTVQTRGEVALVGLYSSFISLLSN